MPLYFAYGSNMDVEAMAQRCPRSKALGPARLARHRFFIMESGWASVLPDPRQEVPGVLWDLALPDVRLLDAYEEIRTGLYKKIMQPVLRGGGASARALVYVGTSARIGTPQADYMEQVIAAARHWSLPENHVRALQALVPPGSRANEATLRAAPAGSAQSVKLRPRYASPLDKGRI